LTAIATAGTLLFVPIISRKLVGHMTIEPSSAASIGQMPPLLLAVGSGWIVGGSLAAIAVVALALAAWHPALFARCLLWIPVRLFYRIRISGRENIPAKGPVLYVCNHVSFIDPVLLFMSQKRPIYFMVYTPFTRMRGLRTLLRFARVIPIDGGGGPRALVQSLRNASEILAKGEAVCVFAEGGITRTGFLLPFQRGFEQILKRTPAAVVPVCLDQVWGSTFSFRGGRFFGKWPRALRRRVGVSFGKPMPPTVTAFEARQAVQELQAGAWVARMNERLPVHRNFVRYAARHPFRTCFIDVVNNGKTFSYAATAAGARILSRLLRPMLADEPMVGVWLPSSVGGAFANIALALLGKVPVNLNYTLSESTTASAAKQCNLRHVLTSRIFLNKVPLDLPGVEFVYLEDFRKIVTSFQRLRAWLAVVLLPGFVLDRWVYRLGGHTPNDLAGIIFSSGSTGDPKGVMLTHANLAANTESVIQAIDPGPKDRILGLLPFFHSFGFTVTLWVPLQVGASLVYYPDPRQAKEVGDLCRKYQCTIMLTTPTFLRFNLKRSDPGDFSTLRLLICGAEKMPVSLGQEFKEKFGVLPLEGYGCTELSPVAASNVPNWQSPSQKQIGTKAGTIGLPVPGVAARVVSADTFETLPQGQEGLLLFYGANVMKGYLGKDDLTRQVIHDGWYCTGDMAIFDEDGFITLTGRLSRFSKIGGEMVPHQKIEEELQSLLGTPERACVVTAVPDPRRGERIIVLLTPLAQTNRHQLCEQLATKGLPNLWMPSERDFYEIPELPLLGTGKLDLRRVKEMAMKLTNGI
jgi:acyl-[acyl-carrier-protein]-phospholipid O-acyltransferase/long-chain-fatty-acid--[acyl-carrier-protein] ligase